MKKTTNKDSKMTNKTGKKKPVKQPVISVPATCSNNADITKIPKDEKKIPKGIPIELMIEYRNKGLSMSDIARLLDCDKSNVVNRLKRVEPELIKLNTFKRNRADIFASIQQKITASITDEEIQKAPLNTKTYVLGVIYDKERLERGQSTGNIAVRDVASHYSSEINKLSKQRQEIMQQLGMSTDTDTSAHDS